MPTHMLPARQRVRRHCAYVHNVYGCACLRSHCPRYTACTHSYRHARSAHRPSGSVGAHWHRTSVWAPAERTLRSVGAHFALCRCAQTSRPARTALTTTGTGSENTERTDRMQRAFFRCGSFGATQAGAFVGGTHTLRIDGAHYTLYRYVPTSPICRAPKHTHPHRQRVCRRRNHFSPLQSALRFGHARKALADVWRHRRRRASPAFQRHGQQLVHPQSAS